MAQPVAQQQKLLVTVPPGIEGGQVIQIQAARGGKLLRVAVPAGLKSGDKFYAMAPAVPSAPALSDLS